MTLPARHILVSVPFPTRPTRRPQNPLLPSRFVPSLLAEQMALTATQCPVKQARGAESSPHGVLCCRAGAVPTPSPEPEGWRCVYGSQLEGRPCLWCPRLVRRTAPARPLSHTDASRQAETRRGAGPAPGASGALV